MDFVKVTARLKSSLRKKLHEARVELRDSSAETTGEPVHQARESIKKARALLRLARKMADKKRRRRVAAHLREAAHRLGPLRDAAVLRETVGKLKKRDDPAPPPLETGAPQAALRQARDRLRSAEVEMRRLLALDWDAAGLEPGFRRLYKRSRRAMKKAAKSKSDEDIHAWRRRTKDLYYALKVLPRKNRTRSLARKLKRLTGHLGDDHDLAFLERHVASSADGKTHRALLRRAGKRRRHLQKKAFREGRRLLHRKAHDFVRHLLA